MKSVFSVSVFVALLLGNVAGWSYSNLDEWPETCKTGKRQSPIALKKSTARKTSIPTLNFNYANSYSSSIENNGHTVEIRVLGEQTTPTISGGNLAGEYALDNIHFHWDSEHTINGKRYASEGHFVHYKSEYGNVTNALNHSDGIVVLAVLFKKAFRNNEDLDKIIAATKIVARQVDAAVEVNGLDIVDILPNSRENFYKYEGSLTTPACNEVVTWIVFDRPLSISQKQLNELSKVVSNTGEKLTKNYRPLQKLNGRTVLYT